MKSKEEIIKNAINIRRPKKINGIYFLIKSKQIVYVGSGSDIRTRIESHILDKKKKFDSYYILENDLKRLSLSRLEADYIREHKPIFNRTANPDYHEGKRLVWFKYLTVKPNIAEISRELDINFQIVNGIIKENRKKKDVYFERVVKYLDEYKK